MADAVETKKVVTDQKLKAMIEQIARPYLENCCGLARDGYEKVDAFATCIATKVLVEIERLQP